MENSISQDQYSVLLGVLAIAIISLSVLGFIAYKQQKRIKYLTTPRYGFIGKPLALAVVMLMGFGTIGAIYLRPEPQPDSISVTDRNQIVLEVKYTELDDPLNLFELIVTPVIEEKEWGDPSLNFNVMWEINKAGKTVIRNEENLNLSNPGGIQEYLEPGLNTIRVGVSVGFVTQEKVITIFVE